MRDRIGIAGCRSGKTEFDNVHDSSTPRSHAPLVMAPPFLRATGAYHIIVAGIEGGISDDRARPNAWRISRAPDGLRRRFSDTGAEIGPIWSPERRR